MKPSAFSFFFGFFLLIFFSSFSETVDKSTRFSISGKITDKHSGEALVGATIFIKELKTGAVTDVYGNYSLTLTTGKYSLISSYVDYKTIENSIDLTRDFRINLELEPLLRDLKEVEITSEKNDKNVVKPEMSTFRMDIKTIQRIPALFGEVDEIGRAHV